MLFKNSLFLYVSLSMSLLFAKNILTQSLKKTMKNEVRN